MRKILFFALLLGLFSSCFKEDDPMPGFSEKTTTIEMTQYYQFQTYFDLGENEAVAINDKSDWDLDFECADSTWHIRLNTSAFMMAANTGITDFDAVTDTVDLNWKFDKSDGNPDSLAIGPWFEINGIDTNFFKQVYVIDRGLDHVGNFRGFKKVVFTKVDANGYHLKFANLDGSDAFEAMVPRDPLRNYINFSFENGGEVIPFEPPANDWDLLFTMYTTLLYTNEGEPYPYILTGVLTNEGVEVAVDSTITYDNLTRELAEQLNFSDARDAIGYDWKYLEGDPTTGGAFIYKVRENWSFVIRNRNGVLFKFRFVRFYNDEGEKGYPTFTYSVL